MKPPAPAKRETHPMTLTLQTEPLTAAAFAPFGDVLDATGPFKLINQDQCRRHHDRARLDFTNAGPGISIFHAEARTFPYTLSMIERHPLGSQAFIPMTGNPFLMIVATDPHTKPRALLTNGAQGINLHKGTWHGVLTPLTAPGLFAVIDRIGDGQNLEEHHYAEPWVVTR